MDLLVRRRHTLIFQVYLFVDVQIALKFWSQAAQALRR